MSTPRKKLDPSARTHIVLIPGFAGFDALGQMEYYAGVTPQFRAWKDAKLGKRDRATLHYFDNLPTAAVETRATKLRDYLAKRIARGEFQPGDSVALVGHSTGGLDIRRMIWDLHLEMKQNRRVSFPVDGTAGSPYEAPAAEILRLINRIVFLSVPQYGTNIADWVRRNETIANLLIAQMRTGVEISQIPLLDALQQTLTDVFADGSDLDLMQAIDDALREAEVRLAANHMQAAESQECASELALYLRQIATDFSAIDDLAAKLPEHPDTSPAHFNKKHRADEKRLWKRERIETMSFATLGPRPSAFAPKTAVDDACDLVYWLCYQACANGPFEHHDVDHMPKPRRLKDEKGLPHTMDLSDNDGIVNTASMLWPNGSDTVLVNADHMDIVGHFHRTHAAHPDNGRRYNSYNLLKSGSGFNCDTFRRVWSRVFDFCVA